ncbi:hypothetical protein PUV47_02025 [Pseudovibrio exalbescens]|uniref:hypothetical protein n=1 Tax=Pseudovibrio exalbescens TaxID=197461 RepID=UPI002365714F|nr:hypothetical protein [Pseudovibrio exalbescens]MDD7908682.1 hypothetical protein [Pseudovibrio exalbescens]
MSERIPENVRRADYTAAAGQTDFIISFPYQDPADVAVARYIGAGGDEDGFLFLSQPDDFEVVGQQIVLVTPAAANDVIRVEGSAALKRVTGIAQSGKFASKLLDGELDRRVMVEQELGRDLLDLRGRAFVARFDEEGGTLPGKSARAGRTLAFDQAGEPKPGPTADEVAQAQSHAQAAAGSAGAAQASATQANTAKAEAISARDAAWAQVKAAKPKNWVINGGFTVNQRNPGVATFSSEAFFADRWKFWPGAGGAAQVSAFTDNASRVDDTYPSPVSYLKCDVTQPGRYLGVRQDIPDLMQLAGKRVTVMFKSASNSRDMRLELKYDFKSQTPQRTVRDEVVSFQGPSSWEVISLVTDLPALETTDIVNDLSSVSVRLWQNDDNTNPYTFRLGEFGLYEGDWSGHLQPFTYETFEETLQKCLPYYTSSYCFQEGDAPGSVTNKGAIGFFTGDSTLALSTFGRRVLVNFPTPLVRTPDVTIYSPGSGVASKIEDVSSSSDLDASIFGVTPQQFYGGADVGAKDRLYHFHYTADAEI